MSNTFSPLHSLNDIAREKAALREQLAQQEKALSNRLAYFRQRNEAAYKAVHLFCTGYRLAHLLLSLRRSRR